MASQVELQERIRRDKDKLTVIKNYCEGKYVSLSEAIVHNDRKDLEDLLKGQARAYKDMIDLLK